MRHIPSLVFCRSYLSIVVLRLASLIVLDFLLLSDMNLSNMSFLSSSTLFSLSVHYSPLISAIFCGNRSHFPSPPHPRHIRRPCLVSSLTERGTVWNSTPYTGTDTIPSLQGPICQYPSPPKVTYWSLSPSQTTISKPFDHNLCQWGQLIENQPAEWHHLTPSPCVDSSLSSKSVSTPVETRSCTDASGREVRVPVDRLDECLLPLFLLHYLDQCPSRFDTSRFCHGMCLSSHHFNIRISG